MDRDEIIRMAREAHLDVYGLGKDHEKFVSVVERFATLVYAEAHKDGLDDFETVVLPAAIKAEREACAKYYDEEPNRSHYGYHISSYIRSRGQNGL